MASEPRDGGEKSDSDGAPPLPFKSWSQLYLLVIGVLALMIAVFAVLKWKYQ